MRDAFAVVLAMACAADPGYQGRSSTDWITQLSHADAVHRAEAARALGHVLALRPRYPRVVSALVDALGDTSDLVQLAAAGALVRDGVRSPEAVPGIARALRDSAHARVRAQSAVILGQMGEEARAAVPELIRALADAVAEVRAAASAALGMIGDTTETVVSALVGRGADSAVSVRVAIADAFMHLGTSNPSVIRHLIVALSDSASAVRAAAALTLGDFGPRARAAQTMLQQVAAEDSVAHVRVRASLAVDAIEGRVRQGAARLEPTLEERCRTPGNRRDRRC